MRGGTAVLKGAGTLIASREKPEKEVRRSAAANETRLVGLCVHGNPGMATAGMGDVLSGVIGGLLAQNLSEVDAAVLGVCLHGYAGDLAAERIGQRGMLATDLLPFLIETLKDYVPGVKLSD